MQTPLTTFTMLDMSTAHLTVQSRKLLETNTIEGVLFYPKGPWGWFMYVPSLEDGIKVEAECPDDVRQCIEFAQKQKSQWVQFDCDGAIIEGLPLYEEVGIPDELDTQSGRVLAASYARHLTNMLGRKVQGTFTPDGKITVSEQNPDGLSGKLSPEFAKSAIKGSLAVKG